MEQHYQPTKIVFQPGALSLLGELAIAFGKKCMLVTPAPEPVLEPLIERVKRILTDAGIEVVVFNRIRPNPQMSGVDEGVRLAHEEKVRFVVALGGGSVIDTAKLISYCAHAGRADWDKLLVRVDFRNQKELDPNRLPLIAVSTTSGTGSQCTQAAVVSRDDTNEKITVFRQEFFPGIAIVDPELMMTLPAKLTASTGFDAFCHLSESYINGAFTLLAETLAVKGMANVARALPALMHENSLTLRSDMAWADTLGGICLSNGGACIPHFVGEILSGAVPTINHGCSLAIVFPYYAEMYFDDETIKPRLQYVVSMLSSEGELPQSGAEARDITERFLCKIGLNLKLSSFEPTDDQKQTIAKAIRERKRYTEDAVLDMLAERMLAE